MDEQERGDEPMNHRPDAIAAWYFAQLDRLYALYGKPAVKRHFYWIQRALAGQRLREAA